MRSKQHGKQLRREGAIKRLETTLAMHKANAELTVAIMEEKKELVPKLTPNKKGKNGRRKKRN